MQEWAFIRDGMIANSIGLTLAIGCLVVWLWDVFYPLLKRHHQHVSAGSYFMPADSIHVWDPPPRTRVESCECGARQYISYGPGNTWVKTGWFINPQHRSMWE